MKIKNINENFGDLVVFEGDTISDCLYDMAVALAKCGHFIKWDDGWALEEGRDYEIIDE